uniref:hypothetical protein n=1 Tax=Segatella hominis TaxID=2518605 RepID=UPI004038B57D
EIGSGLVGSEMCLSDSKLPMRCLGLRRNFSGIVRKIKLALAGKAGELPNFIPTRQSYSDFKHPKNSKSYDKTKG